MSQSSFTFVDEYHNVHIQDRVLGQGGQGMVFRTKDPDLAIKLVTDESGNPLSDNKLVKKYEKRFKRVRLLPLPDNLNIAVPVALLNNEAGYVMQLLSEMVPLSNLWLSGMAAENITLADIPAWLSAIPENEAKSIVHYYRTGGLRRRLTALYKCASLLARLHGNGLVYGDISPNNVFISERLEDSSVWLIDADNIRFEITEGGSVVYTPQYGAPELVQGKDGVRPSSDCHAFAVVAFYLLSLIHPFIGRKIEGMDRGDWAEDEGNDEDSIEKAYAGFFPWVDDQNDDSNYSDQGLPRSLLLTKDLKILFEATFGLGRTCPFLRPTIYHWPEALSQAADITVTCPGCSMSYFYDYIHPETDNHNCPYCKTPRPPLIILESYRWNGVNKPLNSPCWRYAREITDNAEITIPRRVFDEFTMVDSDSAEAFISLKDQSVLIKKAEESKIGLLVAGANKPNNGFTKVYSQIKIDRPSPEMHFWMFAHLNSPRLVLCSVCGGYK